MRIINATKEDKEELLALYHAMIGGPCEWSENYPDENTIAFDLKNEDLFVMKNDPENYQGCASERICRDVELQKL